MFRKTIFLDCKYDWFIRAGVPFPKDRFKEINQSIIRTARECGYYPPVTIGIEGPTVGIVWRVRFNSKYDKPIAIHMLFQKEIEVKDDILLELTFNPSKLYRVEIKGKP